MARSRWFRYAGFSIALVVLACPLQAQDRQGGPRGGFGGGFGGGRGMGTSKLSLLRSEQVQTELKVTPEQKTKLTELQASIPQPSFPRGGQDLSQEERQKQFAEAREKREKQTAEAEKKLEGILKPEQMKRLDEIVLQQQNVDGLVAAPVIAALKLNKDQVEKIKAALASRDEELAKLRPARGQGGPGGASGGRGDFKKMREDSEKVQKKAEEGTLAVLTDEQKTELAKLKGKPFELDRTTFRGGPQNRPDGKGGAPGEKGTKERKRPQSDEI